MESKEDNDESNGYDINIDVPPDPLAPSDLTIDGIDETSFDTSHQSKIILREKVVVIGDSTVGKTALIKSLISNGQEYPKNYVMTRRAEMYEHSIPISKTNMTVDLFIYDLGGQSIFNQRGQMDDLFIGCTYLIFVFDVSSRKSLQNCKTRIDTITRKCRSHSDEDIPCLLIANKIDLRDEDVRSPLIIMEYQGYY